ncbi:TPA: ABC transporter ATP-binding protein [Salmonella enterica subsp. enterica serovar Newport]
MKKIVGNLNLIKYSLSLLFKNSPFLSCLFISIITAQGIFPTLSVITSIRIGNEISTANHDNLFILGSIWALTFVLPGVLAPVASTLQSILNQRATYLTQRKIMEAACRINDLKIIESPEIHDNLEVLSREAAHRPLNLLVNIVDIFRGVLTLASLSLVLASVVWWLPLAFLLPLIPVTYSVAKSQMDIFRALLGKGKSARLIKYYLSVLLDTRLAKEIRLFRSASFFMQKHRDSFAELESELNVVRKKQLLRPQPWNIIYLISSLGVMYWFMEYISTGKISVGGLLGTIQSISYFGLSCQWMVYSFANVGVCFSFFYRLQQLELVSFKNENYTTSDVESIKEIRFENVSFSYNNMDLVLKDINLVIQKGEHLAIVGENGAGKSTLIKLLCKLYTPSSGRITCNGIDISMIDNNIWWEHISTIFQDFGHYNLTVMENVTFSDCTDLSIKSRFTKSCRRANFSINDVCHANTFLGKEYEGTDLSGGQWQRLALARALFSDGELVILDEPTSAMDPRVESQLFLQFSELVKGKTSLMVTHRLGAVKHSSRIIVLKDGELIEDGTPAELEEKQGEYYSLLTLQRNQYAG